MSVLDISAEDNVLEIGCGSGLAVSLVCERLAGGRITAIDRSATAIRRAAERNANHVASSKATLRHIDLAQLSVADQSYDKIFAINVNLFWVGSATPELTIMRDVIRRTGVVHLFYERPGYAKAERAATATAANLAGHGFVAVVSPGPSRTLFRVTARPEA